jgi:uncharacterized protein YcbK (DUF882 family)
MQRRFPPFRDYIIGIVKLFRLFAAFRQAPADHRALSLPRSHAHAPIEVFSKPRPTRSPAFSHRGLEVPITMADHAAGSRSLDRRSFLRCGVLAGTAACVPTPLMAAVDARPAGDRVLSFFNTHTSERLTTAYCCGGVYQPEALTRIDYILRDFRRNEIKPIDPRLLDLLHDLGGVLRASEPFHIISGYRSPATNQALRVRGGAQTGVAGSSLHMAGKAIDIRIPGVRLDRLRGAARSLGRGGVGYYPSSDFVHVDTGRVRYW